MQALHVKSMCSFAHQSERLTLAERLWVSYISTENVGSQVKFHCCEGLPVYLHGFKFSVHKTTLFAMEQGFNH